MKRACAAKKIASFKIKILRVRKFDSTTHNLKYRNNWVILDPTLCRIQVLPEGFCFGGKTHITPSKECTGTLFQVHCSESVYQCRI